MLGKYLSEDEVKCKCGCGLQQLSPLTANAFDMIRTTYSKPLNITSGCRCVKHNTDSGGEKNSAHTPDANGTCHALDIAVDGGAMRYKLVYLALSAGVKRIGVAKNFVHIDTSPNLPTPMIWVY